MKSELNNYGINNPDGMGKERLDVRKQRYDNDDPKAVKEDSSIGQREMSTASETFDDPKVTKTHAEEKNDSLDVDLSSSASSASSSTSMASAAGSSIGGGLGALAGVVASSVVAAAIVVVAFVSTLTIDLSLLMADMTSLVLEVQMRGAQEEDFEDPIYAVLSDETGTVLAKEDVGQNTLTLRFDDLEPGKEYFVKVQNSQKVFAEKAFFTATEHQEKGFIHSYMEGDTDVFVMVENAELKADEYYTLVAKDAQGNVVYTKDGVELFTEYHFTVDEPKDLYFYLMVSGKTYAMSEIRIPEYDVAKPEWTWTFGDGYATAYVSFADKNGGESLVLPATVTKKTTQPTCDADGAEEYAAKAEYEGKTYTKKEISVIESVGHIYEGVDDGDYITYTCSVCGDHYSVEKDN